MLLQGLQGIFAVAHARLDRKFCQIPKRVSQAFEHHGVRVGQDKVDAHEQQSLSLEARTTSAFGAFMRGSLMRSG
jgi:hypothetical protein